MNLSFLIISYNEKEYLRQAIESCLNQNVEDSEIIIADDGSNDGSIDLIREYAAQYPDKIRYLVHDRSDAVPGKIIAAIRVSNGIKRALAIAKGRYCQVLSGDDFLYPGTFCADAVAFLDNNPDYSTYVGGYEKYWEDRPGFSCWPSLPKGMYWSGDYVHISAFIFRKELFEKNLLLPRFCDDTGLHYSLAVSGKWHYAKDLVMAYRQRSGSIMHESDRLELCAMELMLLQDTLQVGKLYYQTLSRFANPLQFVFRNRKRLKEPKYAKYLENCVQYPHDLLGELANYSALSWSKRQKLFWLVVLARCCKVPSSVFLFTVRVYRKLTKIITKKVRYKGESL